MLANHTSIRDLFTTIAQQFDKMYARKAYLDNYRKVGAPAPAAALHPPQPPRARLRAPRSGPDSRPALAGRDVRG